MASTKRQGLGVVSKLFEQTLSRFVYHVEAVTHAMTGDPLRHGFENRGKCYQTSTTVVSVVQ